MASQGETSRKLSVTREATHVIMELKRLKARCKTAFTKTKNKLLRVIQEEHIDKKEVLPLLDAFDKAQDELVICYEKLCVFYREDGDNEGEEAISDEIETMDIDYSETHKRVQETLDSAEGSKTTALGKDLWKQMRRVSIPTFKGDKTKYESWKAAFTSCVDNAPATPEYKLLQLRQYLEGEALTCVEHLGHSKAAYEFAKERLERKFGGKQRQVQIFLDELENFPVLREENAASLEKFADILDIAVINLTEAGHSKDLENGALYVRLQKKLTLDMIARYHRWIYENAREESVIALREWILLESQFRTIAAETVFGLKSKKQNSSFVSSSNTTIQCKMCNGSHNIWKCEPFKQLPVQERWAKAKLLSLCFRCLADYHYGKACKYSRACGVNNCTKNHNRLLHTYETSAYPVAPLETRTHTCGNNAKTYIGLRTVPVFVSNGNKCLKINVLLDDGSTQTYINTSVALALGLPVSQYSENMTVNLLNGKTESFQSTPLTFGLKSLNGQLNMSMQANTIDSVTGNLQAIEINQYSNKWDHLKGIQFPTVGKQCCIDMLIGLDYADLHQSLYEIHGKQGEPIARLTPLGWTCVGTLVKNEANQNFHTFLLHKEPCQLNETLKRFWEIEEGIVENKETPLSINDKLLLEKTEKSILEIDGRYQIDIPWNNKKAELSNNYKMAEKRLVHIEKRLARQPELHTEYDQILQQYSNKGYISKVTENDFDSWFIPHFPVIKPDKATTKVRIVFDASAKYNGLSLNDAIHQGPPLQNDVFDILLRFRRHSVAIACDIQEMYLQIGIPVSDRKFHRFIWRSSPTEPINQYQFSRLVFGINASPFLAQCTSQYNAKRYQQEFPRAAETVLKSTYMDDSIDSVKTVNEGKKLYCDLAALWQKASMHARKWYTSSPEVLEMIPIKDRALEAELLLSDTEKSSVKTLGVLWQSKADKFTFRFNPVCKITGITKREFLSQLSTLYDPLGFIVPYTVRAKMLMQSVWLGGTDWDEELSDDIELQVEKWFSELSKLTEINIPRNLQYNENNNSQIHTFVDASTSAYCAVCYIRNKNSDRNIETNFIAAKSKVVPLKSISVPRLELMAAVLGLNLGKKVCRALETNVSGVTFWSDSLNVLWWIRNQSRQFKPFIANRLGQIQSETNPEQWRYVPTKENPADCGSRGLTVEKLCEKKEWWNGPNFLHEQPDQWPINNFRADSNAKIEQRSKMSSDSAFHTSFFTMTDGTEENRLNPERYSSWTRLIRIFAWVNRFITNCKGSQTERRSGNVLTLEEIKSTETLLIIETQKRGFSDEYKTLGKGTELSKCSKISKLNHMIDEEGIIRCNSRLGYHKDFISYDTRFPIILPRKEWTTQLIVRDIHKQCKHGGTNQVLACLSTRFWVIAAREVIREIESACNTCRRRNAKASQQIMGPIPEARVGKSMRAFTQTAVDYAGPFLTKQGRGKSKSKRYLCVFTCMACRAVHLEMLYSLDTDSFMNTFYRFVSRRGVPETVYSDNATNFVGAVNEMKELINALDKDKIVENVANRGIQWFFIPPAAPHFGGVHESMVKSAKRSIFAILGNADVNDEELHSAFCGAESLINSRPLTYQSSNPSDVPVLTPNHFLHGQVGGQFAPDSVDLTKFNVRKRWRHVQELVKHFWHRWFREFLPMLGQRKKWYREYRDFRCGDVVLVIDPDVGRGQWKLGKVTEIYKGRDNHVRVVNVKIGNKILKRPICRVCLIVENL